MWRRRRLRAGLALAAGLAGAGLIAVCLLAEAAVDYAPPVASVDFSVDGPGANVDDPCFWVDPTDPAKSLLFVTAKDSGLVEVFTLSTGAPVGTIPGFERPNNCAVDGDLLLTTDRDAGDVKVHHLPDLAPDGLIATDTHKPYGIAVLHTPEGASQVYVTDAKDLSVHVYDLATRQPLRTFATGYSAIEPIVTDDRRQRAFVSNEEGHGIGLFTPDGTFVREFGASAFSYDTEGLALYACGDDGYLVASDQSPTATELEVFDRASLAHLGTFVLRQGSDDYTNATDGIDILQAPMARFPGGVLAACDGCGDSLPDEMDVVAWERIADALKLDVCPNGVAPDCRSAPCRRRVLAGADTTLSRATPSTPAGDAPTLGVAGGDAEESALLRFDVPNLIGYDVLDAVVRLVVDTAPGSSSTSGGTLFRVDRGWDEATATFDAPWNVYGEPLATAGTVARAGAVDFDVRRMIRGGGTAMDFAVVSDESDAARYRSREAGESPPALILLLHASAAPAVVIDAAPPAFVTAGATVHLRASAADAEDGDLTARLVWTSDRAGRLGEGAALDVVLPIGTHHVTAAVTDGAYLTGSASVDVRVQAPATPDPCPDGCDDGEHCTVDTCTPTGCTHVDTAATAPAQVLCAVDDLVALDPPLPAPLARRVVKLRAALTAAERAGGTGACLRRARAALRTAKGLERLVARFAARPAAVAPGAATGSRRLRARVETMAGAYCR